uniref:Uncharacterized protein n=1 Tax=Trypanosoma congolense (strain IL3000) TaxID=1068625 RepID=G0US26_TRYCI|nr:hypothetical protein, unlikely [Trypanosoma congolense IL3000]
MLPFFVSKFRIARGRPVIAPLNGWGGTFVEKRDARCMFCVCIFGGQFNSLFQVTGVTLRSLSSQLVFRVKELKYLFSVVAVTCIAPRHDYILVQTFLFPRLEYTVSEAGNTQLATKASSDTPHLHFFSVPSSYASHFIDVYI